MTQEREELRKGMASAMIPSIQTHPYPASTANEDERESADTMSIAARLDWSQIQDIDDDALALAHDPDVKLDVTGELALLVGFHQAIYIAECSHMDGAATIANVVDGLSSSMQVDRVAFTLVVGATQLQLDEDEFITDVKWIDSELFCVSYASGIIRIFSRTGTLLFEQKFHDSVVVKLDVNRNASTSVSARRVDVQLQNQPEPDGELWVLYEDSTVAIIQCSELASKINSAVFGPAQASKFRKYSLRDQTEVVSAIPCGLVRPTIFQSHPRIGVYTIISAGSAPFLAFYQAGNDQNSIIHLAHIATAMATRAAGAVWTFAKSWGWGGSTNAAEEKTSDVSTPYTHVANGSIDAAAEHVPAPIGSVRSIADDDRRRCRVLVLCPSGQMAAISDTLGRIMLIDTSRMTVFRMWKGYRNAQCGWMHGSEGARRPQGLYLVIYSAQRGIVEVWRARYGPRVFSFAVGNNAKLFTTTDPISRRTKCIVLANTGERTAELIDLKASLPNQSILMKYFAQNKLQEENFLLHQIIGGLHAYVKKRRADRGHTLEQDVLDPLLEDIGSLSSFTSIQSLLDVILSDDMVLLSGTFLLKALEKMKLALKTGMSSHSPSGAELLLHWKLLWQQRIISTYIGLIGEFQRSWRVLETTVEISNNTLFKRAGLNGAESADSLSRMLPWLELLRRSGYVLDDETCNNTRKAIANANELSAYAFLQFFSMPFSDPQLPHRRDILSLFEQAATTEEFLREAFRIIQCPIIRKFSSCTQRATFLMFMHAPILSNVFGVQELQQLHAAVFLTPEVHTQLFIEWFFMLPLGTVLAIPPPTQSSSLQRWLQPHLMVLNDGDDETDQGGSDGNGFSLKEKHMRRLPFITATLTKIFVACWKTPKLLHAFVMSEHCGWGELQAAKHVEERTLGKFSAVGGGARWRILQDCIAKTVHISLRIGKMGRLGVEAVENVDDIMRSLAVMQINDAYGDAENKWPKSSDLQTRSLALESGIDTWVAAMENCRNASQMKDWKSLLHAFSQFADKDALCCFRAVILCTAWNAERSDMRQLDDALAELDSLDSVKLKAALATYVWEKYIRVHVMTLISFWEESAAGKKPQRGLQPQVARRFFGIIKKLLLILSSAVKSNISQKRDEPSDEDANESDQDEETDSEEDQGEEALSVVEDGINDETGVADFRMKFLTRRVRWPCPVKDIQATFQERWPPSYSSSTLMQRLTQFDVDKVVLEQIADHLSLILLLDSFAATSVTPVSIIKLFVNKGKDLCRPDTFLAFQAPTRSDESEQTLIKQERTRFLGNLLRHDESLGFSLAQAFGLPLDVVREEHILFLYRSGRDEVADVSIDKMKHQEQLVLKLGSIARARLALIMRRMKAEAEYAVIMSALPVDVFNWIINDTQPPLVADPQVQKLDRTPSLTATHHLLLKCLTMLPPAGVEFTKINAMSVLVKDVITQVKQHSKNRT